MTPSIRAARACLLAFALWLGTPVAGHAEPARPRVLTALPAVHALTATLSAGTTLEVVRLPSAGAVPMAGQANALARLDGKTFAQAVAVVTLSSLWRADPLYAAARRHDLRIVPIDASWSWETNKPGLAVTRVPVDDVPWTKPAGAQADWSVYAWLAPVNAMRMAGLIAADLARLSPADKPRIGHNLAALDGRLRRLKAEYGARLARHADPRVFALANEFVYLFGEFGIFVDGTFSRQDVDWTDADRAALTRYLRERDVRVVVHKWQPDETISRAITDGGARLLILDVGDPGMLADPARDYEDLLRANLDALLAAFAHAESDTR